MPIKDKEIRKIKSREYQKKHYESKKWYYKQKTKDRKKNILDMLSELKQTLKCKSCGEDHPRCLDFHHRNPNDKKISIARVANQGWSLEKIKEEINKCDVLCSNCHRKLHYEENNVGRASAPVSLISSP